MERIQKLIKHKKKIYKNPKWIDMETALEIIHICRSVGNDKYTPLPVFMTYTRISDEAVVKKVLKEMTEAGILERLEAFKNQPAKYKRIRSTTLWELMEIFAPDMFPPADASCNVYYRKMVESMKEWMIKDVTDG